MTTRGFTSWVFDYYAAEINSGPSRQEHSHPAVYALHHTESNQAYVGSTGDLYTRVNKHYNDLAAGIHRNANLQEAYDRSPAMTTHYTRTETKAEALVLEQTLIDEHHPSNALFNIGVDVTNPRKGRTLSEEQRAHLRSKTIEQFSTDEARERQSQRSKQLWQDPDYRAKHEALVVTDETRERLGSQVKLAWTDPVKRQRMMARHSRNPFLLDGVRYDNYHDAARCLNIPVNTLRSRINCGKHTLVKLGAVNDN